MYTSHGHHIPGTYRDPKDDPMPDRCGGVKSCGLCRKEAKSIYEAIKQLDNQPEKE